MRSITRLQRRLGVLSAIAVVTAGGFVLAGPELDASDTVGGASTVTEPASLAPFGIHEFHGPPPGVLQTPVQQTQHTSSGPNPWAANDPVTVLEACSAPSADC
jgi:hypothetical protein